MSWGASIAAATQFAQRSAAERAGARARLGRASRCCMAGSVTCVSKINAAHNRLIRARDDALRPQVVDESRVAVTVLVS